MGKHVEVVNQLVDYHIGAATLSRSSLLSGAGDHSDSCVSSNIVEGTLW